MLSWRARLRDSVAGMKYAAVLTLGLIAAWAAEDFIDGISHADLVASLKSTGFFVITMLLHQMTTVPVVALAIDAAPRTGMPRYAWLIGVGISQWAFCTAFFALMDEHPGANTKYGYRVALIIAACAYRSSVRTAASVLLAKQIEGAALDANVKRARLQLLRAQIEPHFLFNTLATVRALARIDRAAAADMITNLTRYLSEALPKLRQEESSLAEELRLVDSYLRIHQIRMGTRLSYDLLVPDHLTAERIPTMMLLTLVENALKHGINPSVDGGSIQVSAAQERNALLLRVADSGHGMAATEGHGMGLANIRRRLTMLYGDEAILSLARAASRGVVATVSIPLGRTT